MVLVLDPTLGAVRHSGYCLLIRRSLTFPTLHSYIPIKVDYTDLFDVMAFFAGDLRGENAHDDLAQIIARQGQEFAQTHRRYADMEAYVFRLALEWARCSASDRASMDYFGPGT
ncbi:BZ3500_MvSof-1268-A1-R1_Chr2-1g04221 [Microbotryum saponariae]|uniref:BZ3500_MvSof-1268-A1-R1_Chr2-1g04221 protein n=1 Tax=Microbotryum saponariae TaxID=289078 RepID=A0A2X0KHW1_9BASI|nr:BZ3500_MvSof-1268-A1-R1_Chr2-1g04221 [Microbotryum saponariae]SCZ91208.1 BZ3501_MvSof-1269-A2-R1_Chr2-1g03877 [Microbotryum saponariae]